MDAAIHELSDGAHPSAGGAMVERARTCRRHVPDLLLFAPCSTGVTKVIGFGLRTSRLSVAPCPLRCPVFGLGASTGHTVKAAAVSGAFLAGYVRSCGFSQPLCAVLGASICRAWRGYAMPMRAHLTSGKLLRLGCTHDYAMDKFGETHCFRYQQRAYNSSETYTNSLGGSMPLAEQGLVPDDNGSHPLLPLWPNSSYRSLPGFGLIRAQFESVRGTSGSMFRGAEIAYSHFHSMCLDTDDTLVALFRNLDTIIKVNVSDPLHPRIVWAVGVHG
eukprot:gene843-2555_t